MNVEKFLQTLDMQWDVRWYYESFGASRRADIARDSYQALRDRAEALGLHIERTAAGKHFITEVCHA